MSSSSHSRFHPQDPYHNTLGVVSTPRILPPSLFDNQATAQDTTPVSQQVPANGPSVSSPLLQLTPMNTALTPTFPLTAPASTSLTGVLVPGDPAAISRNSSSWQAARNSVLSQMVTSQDLPVPATLPRAKSKTGGRRGRGARQLLVRADEVESAGTALDSSHSTGKNDGGIGDGGIGRGRGRGRGRGGGRPKIQRVGGGLGRGAKRKRRQSEDEGGTGKDDTDDSENFTPLPAQSRSGRRIFKASTFTPIAVDPEGTAGTQASVAKVIPGTVDGGKKGRKRHRKPGDASVCKNCGRGHSPRGNMIVFCDGCNTPWHQHCHDPPITAEVVRVEEKEWFCGDCAVLREEKVQLEGRVSAEGMSLAERRRYLQTLSTSHLVSLLLHATKLHPNLPILSASEATTATSAHVMRDVLRYPNATAHLGGGDDEDTYVLYSETDPLPYPKAGNGVPLPPERDDLAFLIDDDVQTFSHVWNWERSELFGKENIPVDGEMGLGWRSRLVESLRVP
ncbi:hypothetical protein MMC07_002191 [Pseudocyphellaria aurata]|nr:hypothetical protein [Pseudocyphellaria aurata]